MLKRNQKNVAGNAEDSAQRKASSGTIKSESGITSLKTVKQVSDMIEPPRRVNTTKVKSMSSSSQGLGLASSCHVKMEQTRFPKLEEYAHFHYDVLEIPTLKLSICADESSGYKHNVDLAEDSGMFMVTVTGSAPKSWLIKRSLDNFSTLDIQLHRCIFDRKFSHLDDLNTAQLVVKARQEVQHILQNYLSHLSQLAGGMINCGSVLSWMEMDNRGHRLVATDDSGINTPAIAAAHVVKRYNAQAADEISLQVGDMISVIDMPAAADTIWWRGKRGFEVGFFPADCVEIIGDKVPSAMASRIPEPLTTAAASRRPLMKKHGKLLSFLRTFFSHRPPRNQLKQSGIVKERVFGCDLGEHLLNSGHDVPLLLKSCTDIIEEYGIVHGIYRLSGITSNIQKLRLAFDEDRVPDLTDDCYLQDIHSISSLLKMYFRELPNPLLTYQLYDKFADAVRDEDNKLVKIHDVVQQLPPPHYRTTEYLMKHLARVAAFGHETEMHSKNLAIVWAPNLLRSKELEAGGGAAALQGVGIQAVVTECLICYCDIIFSDKTPNYNTQDSTDGQQKVRPKSLAISTPTRLLSLEEARERAFTGHLAPKTFIDVGGGPRNLPSKYHTVIDLPGYRKRAPSAAKENKPTSTSKKLSTTCAGGGAAGGGWKSIFTKPRSGSIKKSRKFGPQESVNLGSAPAKALTEEDVHNWKRHLRSAKSAESLFSLINTPPSHVGSITSRASFNNTEVSSNDIQEHFGSHKEETSSKFQLSHQRSLSSDASTILHNRYCSSKDATVHSQPRDVKDDRNAADKQPFLRDDSTRKALHRRLPSAPNTPNLERKQCDAACLPDGMAVGEEMTGLLFSDDQSACEVNIDAKINSRLLQVAEKSRSAKSNEELTSPLARLANSPPKGRKKAKGLDQFFVDSSDDELLPNLTQTRDRKVVYSSSDICSIADISHYGSSDETNRMRMFYSQFHDYAGIMSNYQDIGILSTPDSQGTMSVSSSGCNMQDVLDQIDTRLAMNAKLFPRQGIGDTSGYRVGDSVMIHGNSDLVKNTELSPSEPCCTTCSTTSDDETQLSNNVRRCSANFKLTEFPADSKSSARDLCNYNSTTQLAESLLGDPTSKNYDNETHSLCIEDLGAEKLGTGNLRSSLKEEKSKKVSTLVKRRHAEFIPSSTATAKDLDELLHSLETDDSYSNIYTRTKVFHKSASPAQDQHNCNDHCKQKQCSCSHSCQSKLEIKVEGRPASGQACGGGMSKCLSVPSDIARSLENVTESQSDMLSSVTISELSMSVNSFSNGMNQDGVTHSDGAKVEVKDSDPRHRRSTSLDSLTESDHLMTRTLREINCQMEAAFKHNQISNSDCSLDSSHQQWLEASDIELSSSPFCGKVLKSVEKEEAAQNCDGVSSDSFAPLTKIELSQTCLENMCDSLPPFTDTSKQHFPNTDVPFHEYTSVHMSSSFQPNSNYHLALPFKVPTSASQNSTSILENQTHLPVTSKYFTSESSPDNQQQLHTTQQHHTIDIVGELAKQKGIESSESQLVNVENAGVACRLVEKETSRHKDEYIVVETGQHKSSHLGRLSSVTAGQLPHHKHLIDQYGRSDIANVCQNRSSSSSSCTSSEEFDDMATEAVNDQEKCKPNLTLPLGNTRLTGGQLESVVFSPVVGERKGHVALDVIVPGNEYNQYQVVRRQHSPRIEQRSLKYHFNVGVSAANCSQDEGEAECDEWKPSVFFPTGSQMDDTETCERMSSLCAAGLMSQRARLSRESSISSLQSPDTSSCPNVLSASIQSPVPGREALPDLVQSTSQAEGTHSDSKRCSVPLQLALYHPDEFSMDIASYASRHPHNSQTVALNSLPQVHSQAQTVVVHKSVLKRSSIDNAICEVTCPELTCDDNHMLVTDHKANREDLSVGDNVRGGKSCSFDYHSHLAQAMSHTDVINSTGSGQTNKSISEDETSKDTHNDRVSDHKYGDGASHLSTALDGRVPTIDPSNLLIDNDNFCNTLGNGQGISVAESLASVMVLGDKTTDTGQNNTIEMEPKFADPSFSVAKSTLNSSIRLDGEHMIAEMFLLHNSDSGLDKEAAAQNDHNQDREMLLSPDLREKSSQCLPSPMTVVTGTAPRTSFSKIPRPKQNSEMTPSPRSTNSASRRVETSLHSSSVIPTSHMDTSPSSSSSSSSSSSISSCSRSGHIRRGSEAASTGSAAKRQSHIRRLSDTKLADLQTTSPAVRCQSSSMSRPEMSSSDRPATSPRSHKTGSTDVSGKSSRIPLSHRVPSPQSSRGAEASVLVISKQQSKIPSPIPKPRKLSLGSKGGHVTLPSEGHDVSRQSLKTEASYRVSSGKGSTMKKEADPIGKRNASRDVSEKAGAKLGQETPLELKKTQTVHANIVCQAIRQVTEALPTAQLNTIQLDNVDTVPFSDITGKSQSQCFMGDIRKDAGDRKTPPPVVARKFHYDSRSLPRWSKFLETQISLSEQQFNSELYCDMLGSRSSLDDSVLQLAAERHDLFVPEITGDGRNGSQCLSLLRVKRSQKMQSLMELFERGPNSHLLDSSGSHIPGIQPRIRTFSGSTILQEEQLTPCKEVGQCDLGTIDNLFLPVAFGLPTKLPRDRCSSRATTWREGDESSQEHSDVSGIQSTNRMSEACIGKQSQNKQELRHLQETEVILRLASCLRKASPEERLSHPHYSPSTISSCDVISASQCSSSAQTARTHSDSFTLVSQCQDGSINVSSSRPLSVSGTGLLLLSCEGSVAKDSSFPRQHSGCAFIHPPDRQSKSAFKHLDADQQIDECFSTDEITEEGMIKSPPPSGRKGSERRNSIKELRQLFERSDADYSTSVDIDASIATQLPVIRSRVRSTSPHTDHGYEAMRDKGLRLSLEIPPSSTGCPNSQIDMKTQPLRLGPKPFYGSQK